MSGALWHGMAVCNAATSFIFGVLPVLLPLFPLLFLSSAPRVWQWPLFGGERGVWQRAKGSPFLVNGDCLDCHK